MKTKGKKPEGIVFTNADPRYAGKLEVRRKGDTERQTESKISSERFLFRHRDPRETQMSIWIAPDRHKEIVARDVYSDTARQRKGRKRKRRVQKEKDPDERYLFGQRQTETKIS